MGLMERLWLAYAPLIFWVMVATTILVRAEKSVQAFSEGSDCRCKCILTTKDGGPCEDGADQRLRKTIYLVETVSGGSDCRCSCQTPPPGQCEWASTLHDRGGKYSEGYRLDDVDLVALHNTVSSMVSAMVTLEKVVSKKSKRHSEVLRRNVNKVLADLKSTNGSYSDLLKDLDLELREDEDEGRDVQKNTGPPLKINHQNNTSGTRNQDRSESIGVKPTPNLDLSKVANFSRTPRPSERSVTSPESTSRTAIEESSTPPSETPDLQQQELTSGAATSNSSPVPETTTKLDATTAPRISPVEPQVIFVPYRSKNSNRKVDDRATHRAKFHDYEYTYDDFDVGDPAEEAEEREAKIDLSTTPPVSLVPNTTLSTTTTTTEREDSYVDYMREYEYGYEYDDDVIVPPTTAATTTKATTPKIDPCGTLFSLSRPMEVSHFGRREGAWMRDPVPSKTDPMRDKRIYIANFYYGSNLIEFDGVEGVKELRYRNSYNLPHKWIGTGHIVYNGSFYYNRAFSRTLIKYNLRARFVSAWSRLTNAVYDPTTPLTWKGHSMVHMAADEDGLWVIFPAQDPFDPNAKLTYIINKINPVDLRIIETFKSKIRQTVSHVFMICGVLYSTDRYDSRRARVTHAFDTRTLVQRSFYLGFENHYSYAVQFSYNPNERKIYAWDSGRQMEYRVSLMH